jgi:hypothetical protein
MWLRPIEIVPMRCASKKPADLLSESEYEEIKVLMWTFRQRPDNVSARKKDKLGKLFDYSPKLQKAYQLREELTAIFDGNYTKVEAKNAIQAWKKRILAQGMKAFESFLTTLVRPVALWRDLIIESKYSSAVVTAFLTFSIFFND